MTRIRVLTLSLGAVLVCALNSLSCSRTDPWETPPTGQLPGSPEAETLATSADLRALTDRLKILTEEVERSPKRRAYGVNRAANYQADQGSPRRVRTVVMSVNVFECDDGCVDGPAKTPASDDDLSLLRPFSETLRTLDLQRTEITDAGLQTVAELTALESLNLAGTAIGGSGLVHLAPLNKLAHLDLSETQVEPRQLQALAALSSLRTVLLPAPAITDEVLAVLGRLPKLQGLALAKSSITDRGLESLTQLQSLETLDLSEAKITDRGLTHLAELTKLTQLRLSRTQITGLGLSHLARLSNLQQLDLADTLADDAGVAQLSGLRRLQSLQLAGTRVRGFALAHLGKCGELRQISLPPIPVSAVEAVNAVKGWHSLSLTLTAQDETSAASPVPVATVADMPDLSFLAIKSQGALEAVHVVNCPRLSTLVLTHDVPARPGAALHLVNLPVLQELHWDGAIRQVEGRAALGRVTKLKIRGTLTSDAVRAISGCRSLAGLQMEITNVSGDPLPIAELSELSHVQAAQVQLRVADASWLLRLLGKMPALQRLDLRGQNLTAQDLAPLCHCTQLKEIYIRGINDSGEPLTFLDSMPALDQCLVLACPHVGRVRLTEKSGVRRFYFKYGQLDELEVNGAQNLTAVYLGNRAFGYHDQDARLPRLDIRRLAARKATKLLYLMVDAQASKTPFTEIALADCPKLRSLTLHAPPPDTQPARCRLATSGVFSQLVERKLYHLATDAENLARLNDSRLLRGRVTEDVQSEHANENAPAEGPAEY